MPHIKTEEGKPKGELLQDSIKACTQGRRDTMLVRCTKLQLVGIGSRDLLYNVLWLELITIYCILCVCMCVCVSMRVCVVLETELKALHILVLYH